MLSLMYINHVLLSMIYVQFVQLSMNYVYCLQWHVLLSWGIGTVYCYVLYTECADGLRYSLN